MYALFTIIYIIIIIIVIILALRYMYEYIICAVYVFEVSKILLYSHV